MGDHLTKVPWDHPDFEGWSIVGMNHYHMGPRRKLFVAMTNRSNQCIQIEGDELTLWTDLRLQARAIGEKQ